MRVKSISECLNEVDNVVFEKILNCLVEDDLEDIKTYIKWKQSDASPRGETDVERMAVLSVPSQINRIIEKIYSDDKEECLDEEYDKLRQRIFEWYEMINTKPDNNNQ